MLISFLSLPQIFLLALSTLLESFSCVVLSLILALIVFRPLDLEELCRQIVVARSSRNRTATKNALKTGLRMNCRNIRRSSQQVPKRAISILSICRILQHQVELLQLSALSRRDIYGVKSSHALICAVQK